MARWALGVDMPTRVTAAGGRFAAKDDWEFYDTIDTGFEYPDHMLTWKGDCCSGKTTYGRERGSAIHGTTGTVILDRDGWEHYDLKDKKVDEYTIPKHGTTSSADLVGADSMTDAHLPTSSRPFAQVRS